MKFKRKDPLKSSFLRALKRNFPQQWPFLQAGMAQGAEKCGQKWLISTLKLHFYFFYQLSKVCKKMSCKQFKIIVYILQIWPIDLVSFSSHFWFFVLVDEVTKNENRLRDFLYDVFRFHGKTGKTGKTKMKNNNNNKIIM